ncbi:MAG: DnaJ-like, subfamily er 28, conserved domain protein [Blastococcus sp.]|jgi:hypothetical protein|nr:DnaJ-like, subfamily er 28, conserved domain protein [Blastococcus sp.]
MEAMTERKPPGMSYETWVESQIAHGVERGDFDNLAGAGKPLPRRSLDESAYEWVLAKARQENLDVFGMLPPGLALRKEREDLPRRALALPSEAAVRALAEDYNVRVQAFWRRPQESRWSPVPGLADVEALVAQWRAARTEQEPEVAPPSPRAVPGRGRFPWWRRRRPE